MPPADRGGSTSVRGLIRSPHSSSGLAWPGLGAVRGTDGQTDGSRNRLMSPYGERHNNCYQFRCLVNRGTMGVNSLPKTVTRRRREPEPSAPEFSTLTTRLLSHPRYILSVIRKGQHLKRCYLLTCDASARYQYCSSL